MEEVIATIGCAALWIAGWLLVRRQEKYNAEIDRQWAARIENTRPSKGGKDIEGHA